MNRPSHAYHHRRHHDDLSPELAGLEPAELIAGEADWQLAAHGPEGDGAISAVAAEAEGIDFVEQPEVPAPPPEDSYSLPE